MLTLDIPELKLLKMFIFICINFKLFEGLNWFLVSTQLPILPLPASETGLFHHRSFERTGCAYIILIPYFCDQGSMNLPFIDLCKTIWVKFFSSLCSLKYIWVILLKDCWGDAHLLRLFTHNTGHTSDSDCSTLASNAGKGSSGTSSELIYFQKVGQSLQNLAHKILISTIFKGSVRKYRRGTN